MRRPNQVYYALINFPLTLRKSGGAALRAPYTLHPTSYTPLPTPYTIYFHPVPQFLSLHPYAGRGGLPRVPPTPYNLHPAPYTLHPTPYTLHPIHCTLHPIPYTLHPTLYTLLPPPRFSTLGRIMGQGGFERLASNDTPPIHPKLHAGRGGVASRAPSSQQAPRGATPSPTARAPGGTLTPDL